LDNLAAGFKVELLKNLCRALLWAQKDKNSSQWMTKRTVNGYAYRELVEWTRLLSEVSKPASVFKTDSPSHLAALDCGDDKCAWWTNLLCCAVNWEAGDLPQARLKYQAVRNAPKALLTEPISLALGHAFCARKLCLEHSKSKNYEQVVWVHCTKSLASLNECVDMNGNKDSLENLIRALTYDWILQSLIEVWANRLLANQYRYWEHKAPLQLAITMQKQVTALRKVVGENGNFEVKLFIYDIFSRMMVGANPTATQHMFNRCCRLTKVAYKPVSQADYRFLEMLKQLLLS